MENKIFWKSISVDHVFYGFDPEIGLHFYFHYKPFSGLRRAKRERERERERRSPHSLTHTELSLTPILSLTVVRLLSSVTHTDPLPHNSPSSTHSSLSTKRKPMVSFLFQLIHFSIRLHLSSDPHTFDLTSPHLRFTSPQTQICQNPPSNP